MKLIEVVADERHVDDITRLARVCEVVDFRLGQISPDNRLAMRLLVHNSSLQRVLDLLQDYFGQQEGVRVIVLPVETVLPKLSEEDAKASNSATESREALYNQVFKGTSINSNYFALVALSTVVAVLGLLENSVAVVIGAMVIAPLLGPNLAVAYGTTLGDTPMVKAGLAAGALGVLMALAISYAIGFFWTGSFDSFELMARSQVGVASLALALASGAAATLSLTTGVSSVLVGVMVAVALLPPTAAMGLFASQQMWANAYGAGLLLAVNLVSVIFSANIVFTLKGFQSRTIRDTSKLRVYKLVSFAFWLLLLGGLAIIVATKKGIV